MNVCVAGLWHLGSVTAACLAAAGHRVTAYDPDDAVVRGLQQGQPPLFEPGLPELVRAGLDAGTLSFHADAHAALQEAEIVWVTYDTPVDDNDCADDASVVQCVQEFFPHLRADALVMISSQLPVGTTRRLAAACAAARPEASITFGCSPENLRLGKAIEVFTKPDRIVVGLMDRGDRTRVTALLQPLTDQIIWMSVESAEMTKHALNAFLATSVTFANEIARVCEAVGADAREVEQGLKSEMRIGPRAYLKPGAAFAGGTLARDVVFLQQLSAQHHLPAHLIHAVRASNDAHKLWARACLEAAVGTLRGALIAVWGLTYKPGTSTLRRSTAVELCAWLTAQGARVQAHDPAVTELPPELRGGVQLCASPLEAARGAQALVVATEWPDYRQIDTAAVHAALAAPNVIDANGFLSATLGADARMVYRTVGTVRRV